MHSSSFSVHSVWFFLFAAGLFELRALIFVVRRVTVFAFTPMSLIMLRASHFLSCSRSSMRDIGVRIAPVR